jgi:hypothetical protein
MENAIFTPLFGGEAGEVSHGGLQRTEEMKGKF